MSTLNHDPGNDIATAMAAMRIRLFAGTDDVDDVNDALTAEVTEKYQLDLDDDAQMESAGLEDRNLIDHMANARQKYSTHLQDMRTLPDLITLRAKHVDCISRISDEISTLSDFYNDHHAEMESADRARRRLSILQSALRVGKSIDTQASLDECIKLLVESGKACDAAMKQIKSTQQNIFVLRRDIDFNMEQMLNVMDAHRKKVTVLDSMVQMQARVR